MALVSKTFSQIITFTRASTATFFNSAGTLTSAAVDAPRFDYNPSTLAAQGLLIEESRTNLTLQSEDFATTWTVTGATVSTNATTAPTGTTVADKLVEDTSTGTHITTQSISLGGSVDNSAYVISVFAKASERTRFQLFDNAQASSGITSFDLSNGTVVSGTGTITAVGNGWYRCSVFPLKSTSITSTLTIRLISTGSTTNYTGDGTSGIFVFGAQLEVGAFPTSYIPTTTTALTRAADVASVNTLSPWYNSVEGTVVAIGQMLSVSGPASRSIFDITDGSTVNRINGRLLTASLGDQATIRSGGATQFQAASINNTTTAIKNFVIAYKTSDFAVTSNGSVPVTQASGVVAVGVNQMQLGNAVNSVEPLCGYLRRITYYPRRLSNAELQAITA